MVFLSNSLTLAPIWLPHCPAWMCTISLIVLVMIKDAPCVTAAASAPSVYRCDNYSQRYVDPLMNTAGWMDSDSPSANEKRLVWCSDAAASRVLPSFLLTPSWVKNGWISTYITRKCKGEPPLSQEYVILFIILYALFCFHTLNKCVFLYTATYILQRSVLTRDTVTS